MKANTSKSSIDIFSIVGEEETKLASFTSKEMKTFFVDGCHMLRTSKFYSIVDNIPTDRILASRVDILSSNNLSHKEKAEFTKFTNILSGYPAETLFARRFCPFGGDDLLMDFLGLQ
jgi:hypothetical protein